MNLIRRFLHWLGFGKGPATISPSGFKDDNVTHVREYDYSKPLILFGYFTYHDIEFERKCGAPEDTIAKMKKQNQITERAYVADAKKRGATPVIGW